MLTFQYIKIDLVELLENQNLQISLFFKLYRKNVKIHFWTTTPLPECSSGDAITLKSELVKFKTFPMIFDYFPNLKQSKFLSEYFQFRHSIKFQLTAILDVNSFKIEELFVENSISFIYNTVKFISNFIILSQQSLIHYFMLPIENEDSLDIKIQLLESNDEDITITYENLPIKKNEFFTESMNKQISDVQKMLPSMYSNCDRKVGYYSKFDKNYKFIETYVTKISIFLNPKLCIEIEKDRKEKLNYKMKTGKNFLRSFNLNDDFQSNSFIRCGILVYMIINDVSVKKIDNEKLDLLKGKMIIKKSHLSFEKNIFTISGDFEKETFILRIPMHQRDSIEFYISNLFNSVTDLKENITVKPTEKMKDVHFRFRDFVK
eukprot:gene9775-2101_t